VRHVIPTTLVYWTRLCWHCGLRRTEECRQSDPGQSGTIRRLGIRKWKDLPAQRDHWQARNRLCCGWQVPAASSCGQALLAGLVFAEPSLIAGRFLDSGDTS
jgi:hypothetical protein